MPLVTAWTFGNGFLKQLYLKDYGGCLNFHLVAGFSAFLATIFLKERLGKFKALQISHNEDSDEDEAQVSKYILQLQKCQRKIDKVARSFDLELEKQVEHHV